MTSRPEPSIMPTAATRSTSTARPTSAPGQPQDQASGPQWLAAGSLLAAAFLVVIAMEIWVFEADGLTLAQKILSSVVAPFVALPLAYRGRDPMGAFAVNALAVVVMVTIGYASDVYQWTNLLMMFAVSAAYRGFKSFLALAGSLLGVVYYFTSLLPGDWDIGVMVLALWVVGWLVGRLHGSRFEEERLRADRDLAAEVAATRQERLELEAQRTRMARELHDLIGHTVNVMVVHAGAGRRAIRTDPEGAERAFATIETTGRSALDELDRVLGILRHDDPDVPLTPLPGMAAIPDLVDDFSRAGLHVRLTTSGAVDLVPAGLGLTVYRIVQESLTNTLKHAEATECDVVISLDGPALEVVIADNGRGPQPPESSGRGLTGIAERVLLHGGESRFGPVDEAGSGFEVRCSFSLTQPDVSPEGSAVDGGRSLEPPFDVPAEVETEVNR